MGLFSSIGKFVGGALKTAGDFLPGPIGGVAKLAGGVISGPSVRPAAPTITPTGYVTPLDRITGKTDATTVKGIISNTIRYSPAAGVANAFSDFTGINVGQQYASNLGPSTLPATMGAPGNLQGFTSDLMSVTFKQEARAPKGYRVHTVTESTAPLVGLQPGAKVAVRLGSTAARILGVKRSKKPVLSVTESEALRRAARAQKKVARVAKGAGLHVYTSARSNRSCSTKRSR